MTDQSETDAELHARCAHPDFEYRATEGPRKQWDDVDVPPADDNGDPDPSWERNVDAGRDGWERWDYTEESYWRRRKPAPAGVAPAADPCSGCRYVPCGNCQSADQTALESRIAEAIKGVLPMTSGLACEVAADAVLAVLPDTSRAARLNKAADFAEQVAEKLRAHHEFERSNGALDVMTELRRLADEAQQQPDTETQAEPPTVCWRLEILDGMWGSYGPVFTNLAEAVAHYRSDNEQRPTWNDVTRTPVQRRIMRETTTYTVEQESAAADTGEEA